MRVGFCSKSCGFTVCVNVATVNKRGSLNLYNSLVYSSGGKGLSLEPRSGRIPTGFDAMRVKKEVISPDTYGEGFNMPTCNGHRKKPLKSCIFETNSRAEICVKITKAFNVEKRERLLSRCLIFVEVQVKLRDVWVRTGKKTPAHSISGTV